MVAAAAYAPIGACRTYGCSYVAVSTFAALASAASIFSALPRVPMGAPHACARSVFMRLSLPGSPDHSVHFVCAPTTRAACIASASLGDTTATRFPFVTTSAVGNRFLSTSPTDTRLEPTVAGRIILACSKPGASRSPLHRVLPVTMLGMPGDGCDKPTTVY